MTAEVDRHREVIAYLNSRAPVLFFMLSEKGMIVEANAYAKKLTGRNLVGEAFTDTIIDFTGSFDLTAAAKDTTHEQMLNIETAARLPQSFYFTFKPVNDQVLVFGRLDAEELESMRIEVLALNKDLNNLTRELHQKNAQLKRLNAEKNRFLGMAAHDLRSPVGAILSYSEFLLEDLQQQLDEDHVGFLEVIRRSCSFMQRLVDDFLDVSAIEAGKFELDLQPAALDKVVLQSLHLNTLRANKKGIQIKVNGDSHLPLVMMDAPKIQQAITNLISNAIEYSKPDTAIDIKLTSNNQSIHFSVRDSGPGIAPQELDKLFKPFTKISTKKTAGEKSTGLGLLISRKIIESHTGKIWMESQVGQGTTVHFKLPMTEG